MGMDTGNKRISIGQIIACVVIVVLLGAVFWPVDTGERPISSGVRCLSNVKQMALGLLMYSGDYDSKMPKADRWMDSIKEYAKFEGIFHDPAMIEPGEYGYAFRKSASGLNADKVPKQEDYAVIFDSRLLQRNAHSELWSLPKPGRHSGSNNIGFLDGHAKSIKDKP